LVLAAAPVVSTASASATSVTSASRRSARVRVRGVRILGRNAWRPRSDGPVDKCRQSDAAHLRNVWEMDVSLVQRGRWRVVYRSVTRFRYFIEQNGTVALNSCHFNNTCLCFIFKRKIQYLALIIGCSL